jgi:hypothetical protein
MTELTTCARCGNHVDDDRVEGSRFWERGDGLRGTSQVVLVLHADCYDRLTDDERKTLLSAAGDDQPHAIHADCYEHLSEAERASLLHTKVAESGS